MNDTQIDHAEVVRLLELADRRNIERIVALDRRIDDRFIAIQQQTALAFGIAEKAGIKADGAIEKRLDLLNELRAVVSDQQGTFVGKGEYEVRHQNMERAIALSTSRLDRLEAAIGAINRTIFLGLALLGGIGTLIAIFEFSTRAKP